jgi:NTP pyrophosphatase (non-canonical NTP hydrolase)
MGYPSYEKSRSLSMGGRLAEISKWIDESPANQANTATTNLVMRTTVKLSEEIGEVGAAIIGMTGQNPRKGVTHSIEDVRKELLDVALTALTAVEHVSGNDGTSMDQLVVHVHDVYARMENHAG